MGKRLAKVAYNAAKIASQRRDRNVVANVQRGELFRQVVPVGVREHPLRKIVGKALGEEVMAPERLIGVMEDGRVAAILEPRQQLREGACRLVADSREIGNGNEFERGFCRIHASDSTFLNAAAALLRRSNIGVVTRSARVTMSGALPPAPPIQREFR